MPNFILGQYKNIFENAKTKSIFRKILIILEKNGHLILSKSLTPIFFALLHFEIKYFYSLKRIMHINKIFLFMKSRKFVLAQDIFT